MFERHAAEGQRDSLTMESMKVPSWRLKIEIQPSK